MIQLNAQPEHDFEHPLGLLSDCHRRIERFLGVLTSLAERAVDRELSPTEAGALERALHYFQESAPLHTSDEEESLFPRLRDQPEAQARIASLQQEHEEAARTHWEVEKVGRAWIAQGRLSAEDQLRWRVAAEKLAQLYAAHIALEDGELFPLAAQLLSDEEQRAIGREMAARRGLERVQPDAAATSPV